MEHFLGIAALTTDELWGLLKLARELKAEWHGGGNELILKGRVRAWFSRNPA